MPKGVAGRARLSTIAATFAAACFVTPVLTAPVRAEDVSAYPSRPIRMVVPQTAGGGSDVAARLVTEAAGKLLGQRIVIENKPGAGGRLGASFVAKSPPDGYTLLYTPKATLTIAQFLKTKLDYDPERDLVPVALPTQATALLIVRADLPARTVGELLAYAKKNPGTITFGLQGIGSEFHVTLELLREQAGINVVGVPYSGGAPAIVDLLANRLDAMFLVPAAIRDHLASSRLRALAVLDAQRHPDYPQLPTMIESGFPDFTEAPWFGCAAPAGIPPAILNKLSDAFVALRGDADLAKRVAELGYRLDVLGAQDFAALIAKERKLYGHIAEGGRLDRPN